MEKGVNKIISNTTDLEKFLKVLKDSGLPFNEASIDYYTKSFDDDEGHLERDVLTIKISTTG